MRRILGDLTPLILVAAGTLAGCSGDDTSGGSGGGSAGGSAGSGGRAGAGGSANTGGSPGSGGSAGSGGSTGSGGSSGTGGSAVGDAAPADASAMRIAVSNGMWTVYPDAFGDGGAA